MTQEKNHDLHSFMQQMSAEMSAEYTRLQMRALEDPGTAGDQGEENWAQVMRDWLPRSYEVVTKGRIISQNGDTSPQVDVIVLHGDYPKKLLNKKLYLAAGVSAAFECKVTLKASHIAEAVDNCVKIKNLYEKRTGTPYTELHSPIVYGLLAHSHAWKGQNSAPIENIDAKLNAADGAYAIHPRLQLDLLCVADLAAWTVSKLTFMRPHKAALTAYVGHALRQGQVDHFTPIGVLISFLTRKLAWERPSLRELADYYRITNIAGSGQGTMREWPTSIYSDEIRVRVQSNQLPKGIAWEEWGDVFF